MLAPKDHSFGAFLRLVSAVGLEPTTSALGKLRSIQLSYADRLFEIAGFEILKSGWHPKQVASRERRGVGCH